jgi:antitoxin YefM
MSKRLTIAEAQQPMLDLPDELTDEPITKGCQPVLVSYEPLTFLLETLEILSNTEFAENLRERIAQADRGKTISWEDA